MKTVYGIISILFMLAAVVLAFFTIAASSPFWAAGYVLTCFFAFFLIAYFFCRKCVDKKHCPHFIFGRTAGLFKTPDPSRYSPSELFLTLLGGLLLIVPPQFELIRVPNRLIVFWILIGSAVSLITLTLCNRCNHRLCPFCRNDCRRNIGKEIQDA